MESINKVWPKWQAVEVLGEGGFGKVYKAKRDSFGEEMYSAIKVIKIPNDPHEVDEMTTSGLTRDNIKNYYYKSVVGLVDEIKMMDKLKSAGHVVGIEDFEVVENESGFGWTIYIRMELLTNITDYLKTVEVTAEEVKKMAIHVLTALEHCHDLNIIHRDIKPANIFISKFGEYKLGDFGVSREVEKTNATLSQKGTKSYMAPEMVRMEKYGKNVDLYALGLTMYELLNHNRMPFLPPYPETFFPTDREQAMLKRLMGQEFPEIEGIGALNEVIKKACHASAEQRYQTATQMKKALLELDEIIVEKTEEPKVEFIEEIFEEDDSFTQETTIGMFGTASIFEKKEEKKQDSEIVHKIVEYILSEFKATEGMDLHSDKLAMGRIESEAKKCAEAFNTSSQYQIDLPYIAASNTGALHIRMTILKSDLDAPKKQVTGFIFDDSVDEEPLQKRCPYCGKTAHLQFKHGYYCPSCDKVITTQNDEETLKLKELCYLTLHEQDLNKRLNYAMQMYQIDSKQAQVVLRVGQILGNLNRNDEQLQKYNEALSLDNRDGTIYNNLAVSHVLRNQYQKALQYSTQAVMLLEKGSVSDWSSTATFYANHSLSLEVCNRSKEAFEYLKKAYSHGYPNCDTIIQRFKCGSKHCQEVVSRVLRKYQSSLTNKCHFDEKSLQKAKTKFQAFENSNILMHCDPAMFGSSNFGIAFGDTAIHFFYKKNYYTGYYFFNQCRFTVKGKKVHMDINNQTYVIDAGNDALTICTILSAIQSEL